MTGRLPPEETAKGEEGTHVAEGIEIIDLALWVPRAGLLAITDLQLGGESMLNAQGIFIPRTNFVQIKERLEDKIFHALKGNEIRTILINGDLKHEFGTISNQERREVIEITDFLRAHCKKIVLVKGNHDMALKPIVNGKKVTLVGHFFVPGGKILFVHGDREPRRELVKKAKIIAIGHQHPCITISDGVKRETYKCFLRGKYKGKTLIVMPSMNAVATGVDVLRGDIMSPMIKDFEDFEAYAVEDMVYYMGRVKGPGQ